MECGILPPDDRKSRQVHVICKCFYAEGEAGEEERSPSRPAGWAMGLSSETRNNTAGSGTELEIHIQDSRESLYRISRGCFQGSGTEPEIHIQDYIEEL